MKFLILLLLHFFIIFFSHSVFLFLLSILISTTVYFLYKRESLKYIVLTTEFFLVLFVSLIINQQPKLNEFIVAINIYLYFASILLSYSMYIMLQKYMDLIKSNDVIEPMNDTQAINVIKENLKGKEKSIFKCQRKIEKLMNMYNDSQAEKEKYKNMLIRIGSSHNVKNDIMILIKENRRSSSVQIFFVLLSGIAVNFIYDIIKSIFLSEV